MREQRAEAGPVLWMVVGLADYLLCPGYQGDENWHLHAIDLDSGNVRDLTAWQGVRCHYVITSLEHPEQMLAVLNVRDRKLMDIWRIDVRTRCGCA